MVGFDNETWRGAFGGGGGGYSGARWVALEMRFLTLVSLPVDSELVVLGLGSSVSEGAFEKSPDSRLLDFFLSPNMVRMGRKYAQGRRW